MIGGHGEMRGSVPDHPQHGGEDPAHCRYFAALGVARGRQGVVVPEQLVGTVNQMNLQNVGSSSVARVRNRRATRGLPRWLKCTPPKGSAGRCSAQGKNIVPVISPNRFTLPHSL